MATAAEETNNNGDDPVRCEHLCKKTTVHFFHKYPSSQDQ